MVDSRVIPQRMTGTCYLNLDGHGKGDRFTTYMTFDLPDITPDGPVRESLEVQT